MPADTPDRIGDFEILRTIGRGGMGVLYHARDTRSLREVALKVMSADTLEDDDARARFHHEARLAVRLQHRNIVKVFEFGEDGGVPFIAMEFLRGQSLAERLTSGEPMPLAAKLDVVIQVCEGLQCLHEEGIVHRDVKPGNIWLLEDGGVKLLDLGIAKHAGVKLTQFGNVVGSAAYMAPEQLSGQPVDGRADVFSAGVVLFELLSGQRPFQADSITAVMMKVLHEPVPDIRSLVPGVSADLAHSLDTALQKDPAQRYAEAADFGSDLRLARDAGELPLPAGVPPSGETARRDLPLEATMVATRGTVAPLRADPDPVLRHARDVAPAPPLPTPPASSDVAGRRSWLWAGMGVGALALAGLLLAVWRPAAEPSYVLDVRSTPAGAEVSVDGAVTGQRTPAVVTLLARPLRIGLTLSGYERVDEPVAPTADTRMNLEYRLRRLLRVHSQPTGARIVLDGRETGLVTPAVVPLESPHPAGVELHLEGHESRREPLTEAVIASGALTVTLAAARKGPAGPVVPAAPRALPVAVNLTGAYRFGVTGCGANSPAATTHTLTVTAPCTLRLRASEYLLDVTRSVTATAGGHMDLAAPPLARVQLRSRHEACTLSVSGRALGSPPANLEIAAGSYSATLQCPDGRTLQTRPFEIEAGMTSRRIDDYLLR